MWRDSYKKIIFVSLVVLYFTFSWLKVCAAAPVAASAVSRDLLLSCGQALRATALGATSLQTFGAAARFDLPTLVREPNSFSELIRSTQPVIALHGKNDNIAPESTWRNWAYAFSRVGPHPAVLEVDVQITKDGVLAALHDPTFHVMANWYQTPPGKTFMFFETNPHLKGVRQSWDRDYYLFDNVESYTWRDIRQTFQIYDPLVKGDMTPVSLEELLEACQEPCHFNVPRHIYWSYETHRFEVKERESIALGYSPVIFADFKPINNLALRLYGLGDWNWILNALDEKKLQQYTLDAVVHLSRLLKQKNAYHHVFVAARHPEVARLIKLVDPRINIMISPDIIRPGHQFSSEEFIAALKGFYPSSGDLVEVRYLTHLLDWKLRAWIAQKELRIFYDQIPQTDKTQFDGKYKDNLPALYADIFSMGEKIWVQTNTPEPLAAYLDQRYREGSQ